MVKYFNSIIHVHFLIQTIISQNLIDNILKHTYIALNSHETL